MRNLSKSRKPAASDDLEFSSFLEAMVANDKCGAIFALLLYALAGLLAACHFLL
ncbi:MAG: hypothetical protein AB1705_20675 [Verrucomicrobiota bacterium]